MTTLTLYKGVAFDGVNSFPHITTKSAFDGYLAGKQQYSQAITYNRIGDTILINLDYDTAVGYGYGCIDTGSKKYYIIPDSLSVNENNRVYLSYSVDWYTTLKYDNAISFGRAHLIKSTTADPKKYPQAISPMDMTISSKTYVGENPTLGYGGMVVSYEKDDKVNFIFSPCHFFRSSQIGTADTLSPISIFTGEFFALTGILPANVINVWYIPFNVINGYWIEKNASLGGTAYSWYESDSWAIGTGIDGSVSTSITTDNVRKGVITDRNGGIVYVVPYGRTLTKIEYGTVLSTTQCFTQLKLTFTGQSSSRTPDKNVENAYVLIPCDSIDYINSAYLNWSMGKKSVEIEERRIQRNKNLAQGIGGAALTGALGATAGPAGAAMGVAGGIGGALLPYGVDRYYESATQRLEDWKYQLTQDEIIPGSLIPNTDGFSITAYQLSASTDEIARYNAEMVNFGADCNIPLSQWTPSPGAYKFADVEIIADVPYSIKQAIKNKMISGIKIVGV